MTIIFRGGPVLTMDPSHPSPEVVVVKEGRIAAVGSADLAAAHPDASVVDLAGGTLAPGFIDAHHHVCIAALHPRWADLSTVRGPDELVTALREQAARQPEAEWVRGHGFDASVAGFTVDRDVLDSARLDRPIVVADYSVHEGTVCSRGLDTLGIGPNTPDPVGGEHERGSDGRLTGRLVERAWSQAHARSMSAYLEPDRWAEHVAAYCRSLLADGITAVHDAACPPEAEALYAAMRRDDTLPVSVLALPHPLAILDDLDRARLDGPPTGEGDERLRTGPVKLFADGGVLPAIDAHIGGHHVEVGMLFPGLGEACEAAVGRGFDVAVHAIGNAGLEAAFDAFEAAARGCRGREPRFRVEHVMLASRQQLSRMAAANVVGVVQPGFVHHVGALAAGAAFDDVAWLPFADLVTSGTTVAASSDAPCQFHAPLRTSACGATRLTRSGEQFAPDQAVAFEAWLHAYTAGAAYAGGQEHERGRLRPGLVADLVVLDGELDAEAPPTVRETWVAGRRVHPAA